MDDDLISEFEEKQSPVDALKKRYQQMDEIYGVSVPLREDDCLLASFAIGKKDVEEKRKMAEFTVQSFQILPTDITCLEKLKSDKRIIKPALEYYKQGYEKLSPDILNKEDFYKDIERVEKKLK